MYGFGQSDSMNKINYEGIVTLNVIIFRKNNIIFFFISQCKNVFNWESNALHKKLYLGFAQKIILLCICMTKSRPRPKSPLLQKFEKGLIGCLGGAG